VDNILLTHEEIEKRNELFEYEMTQVILNLKGQYAKYDRNNSPVGENSAWADDVFGKRLDFAPLSDFEFEFKAQEIPPLDCKTSYIPVTDIKSIVKLPGNVPNLIIRKIPARYFRRKKIKPKVFSCAVPKTKVEAGYASYVPKKPVSEFESEIGGELFAYQNVSYAPVSGIMVGPALHTAFRTNCAIGYSPVDGLAEIQRIPEAYIHDVAVQYVAFENPAPEQPTHSIVSLKSNPVYAPLQVLPVSEIEADVPIPVIPPQFKPFVPVEVHSLCCDVPETRGIIEFIPIAGVNKHLPKIKNPKSGKMPDFELIKPSPVNNYICDVPETKVNVKISPLQRTKSSIRSIDTVPEEVVARRDFYAIWDNL
jgi:hypothetical protein